MSERGHRRLPRLSNVYRSNTASGGEPYEGALTHQHDRQGQWNASPSFSESVQSYFPDEPTLDSHWVEGHQQMHLDHQLPLSTVMHQSTEYGNHEASISPLGYSTPTSGSMSHQWYGDVPSLGPQEEVQPNPWRQPPTYTDVKQTHNTGDFVEDGQVDRPYAGEHMRIDQSMATLDTTYTQHNIPLQSRDSLFFQEVLGRRGDHHETLSRLISQIVSPSENDQSPPRDQVPPVSSEPYLELLPSSQETVTHQSLKMIREQGVPMEVAVEGSAGGLSTIPRQAIAPVVDQTSSRPHSRLV